MQEPPTASILVCGPNWIGDSLIAMPALQAYRRRHPAVALTVLVKRPLMPLWQMHAATDRVLGYVTGVRETLGAGRALRPLGLQRAFVLPHSFRSALIPFVAGIPERIGMPGHHRNMLLSRTVPPPAGPCHQALEYVNLMVPETLGAPLDAARLVLPAEAREAARQWLAPLPRPRVAVLPGAARGPAKRWPADRFGAAAERLARECGAGIVSAGSAADRSAGEAIAAAAGPSGLNLAGRTSLPEWAALLAGCDLVLCNDSGGMHLAAAVHTPLVAVFGATDPAKTGPLGDACTVLQHSRRRSRDVRRRSAAARRSLEAIAVDEVVDAARRMLEARSQREGY